LKNMSVWMLFNLNGPLVGLDNKTIFCLWKHSLY
jgi:hypothetical protein